ncbi:hypothetical protein [Paenibacillus eucommiae]|uniref:Uncharacterized protein n=1 Tax=Paenibacillus eucommiae TaxID=1355755 RepID=A0ABS4J1L0_9BACL|nr:hypothetical protein [Paenibacillus eucommiae]MBP1993710.1 hypothetical protein [Paenibacillus eucommiae]
MLRKCQLYSGPILVIAIFISAKVTRALMVTAVHRSPLEVEMQRNEIVTVTDGPYRLKRGRLWGKPPSNGRGCLSLPHYASNFMETSNIGN